MKNKSSAFGLKKSPSTGFKITTAVGRLISFIIRPSVILMFSLACLLQQGRHCIENGGHKGPVPVLPVIPEPEHLEPENVTLEDGAKRIKWAHSVLGLKFLAENEFQLYELMKQLEDDLDLLIINHVTSWLDDFEDSSIKGTQHLSSEAEIIEEISSHPLMALRMIRRYVQLEQSLRQGIKNTPEEFVPVIQHFLNDIRKTYALPNTFDHELAMDSIINLRYVYELNVDDIINGTIFKAETNVGLTRQQVYEIALRAERNLAFTEAFLWLTPIYEQNWKLRRPDGSILLDSSILQSDVDRISVAHNRVHRELTVDNYWNVRHRFTTKITGSFEIMTTLTEKYSKGLAPKDIEQDFVKYLKLCSGLEFQTEEEKSKLICFYESKLHPVWLIGPLKIEVHSWDPYLIRIYDVINQTVSDFLMELSEPLLETAKVVNMKYDASNSTSPADMIDNSRIASFVFLDFASTILVNLESRISKMTGLDVRSNTTQGLSSEAIQVASYAYGGYYEYHQDNLPTGFYKPLDGDRIATFMIYLNDVRLGGHTVFPKIGISVKPIARSGVFWYNTHRNGNVHQGSLHGGCAVVLGSKWISNTWIRSFASFQRRRCSLNPDE